jgi:hypothetical protein
MLLKLQKTREQVQAELSAEIKTGAGLLAEIKRMSMVESSVTKAKQIAEQVELWDQRTADVVYACCGSGAREDYLDYAFTGYTVASPPDILEERLKRLRVLVHRLPNASEPPRRPKAKIDEPAPATPPSSQPAVVQATLGQPVSVPETLTAAWLWHSAPLTWWAIATSALIASFVVGTLAGQLSIVREFLIGAGRWQESTTSTSEQSRDGGR